MCFSSDLIWKLLLLQNLKFKMKKLIILLISVISMYSVSAQKYTDQYIKDASNVSKNWLNNINNKQYKNAFQILSSEVRAIYEEKVWIGLIDELMLEFGGLESRIATNKRFKSEVEGMDNGFYVLIDYKVSYTNTTNHNERILLKQNDKKIWEIIDYTYEFKSLR